jgi:PAS domain S-box-containing protein
MFPLRTLLERLGFSRQLGLIVAFFALTIVCLLGVVGAALHVTSGVRAYVGGEGLWSKSQKAAVRALEHAIDGDDQALVYFESIIAVPLGDRRARRALEQPHPDPEVVTEGFVAGRNHPSDVPAMTTAFRRLRWVPQVARAADIWRRADREILRLVAVADRLRRNRQDPTTSSVTLEAIRRKVGLIDARVTPLEDAFSASLADGARLLQPVLMVAITAAAAVLLALGLLLSRWVMEAVRESAERQRLADAALRASEERYRELFDNANDLAYSHDLAGNLLSVNGACLRTTGYAREEVLGKNIATILAPTSVERAKAMIAQKLTAGGSTTYELEIVARDGRHIPIEVSTRLLVEKDRPVAVHGIARDISERKRAEAALAQEARVAAALARVGREVMSSLETPVLFERLCEVTMSVLGGGTTAIALWDPRSARWSRAAACGSSQALDRVVETLPAPDDTFEDDDVRLLGPTTLAIALRRGGDVVGAAVAAVPSPFAADELRIAAGVALVGSMALANADLVTRLEEAGRLRSEFVSTMSHELRTPLNVMLGYTEMLRDTTDDDTRWALLDRMEASGRDLLELIESTLDLGRIEAGRDSVRIEPISLRTLLLAVGASCSRFPRRPSVLLRWPVDPPDCMLATDPRKLTVVLRNLVGNALKFTEHGFVQLEAELTSDAVVLRVRDSGIGIRREDHERIFDMFRQADGSDSRRFGGTGLGLYIVRRFVRQLGGEVTLTSEPGHGSTFTVTLPRTSAVANAA